MTMTLVGMLRTLLRAVCEALARVVIGLRLLALSVAGAAQPGLGVMRDQNLSNDEKAFIGATGGPERGHHGPHRTGASGMRDVVTPAASFGNVSRGWPLPYQLPPRRLRAAGLTAASWRCRLEFDPFLQQHHVKVAAVLRRARAPVAPPALFRELSPRVFELDLPALREVARRRGTVRFMKAMQCLNIDSPLGQGLWEGPRLRDVLRELEADAGGRIDNVRRLNFWGYECALIVRSWERADDGEGPLVRLTRGPPPVRPRRAARTHSFHNDDAKQRFRSTLYVPAHARAPAHRPDAAD